MDDTGAISSMLLFRPPADGRERRAAARLLGRPDGDPEPGNVYVLSDLGAASGPAPAPAAAVLLLPATRVWRVLAAGGPDRHCDRLAAEVVRAATAAGAARLVAAPDAPGPVRALLLRCPIPPVTVGGWLTVDL